MGWNLADVQNWQSRQKLSYTRNLRGNAFKGDISWHFDFSTKQYDLLWPPLWRANSCPPTLRPKLLFACISLNVWHIIFSTMSLKFKCKISFQKKVIHSFENHLLVMLPDMNWLILRKWCAFEELNHYYFV